MYYDLALTPPEYGTPLTTTLLVATQLAFTLGLAPVPAGYVAGILERRNRPHFAVRVLLATALLS